MQPKIGEWCWVSAYYSMHDNERTPMRVFVKDIIPQEINGTVVLQYVFNNPRSSTIEGSSWFWTNPLFIDDPTSPKEKIASFFD